MHRVSLEVYVVEQDPGETELSETFLCQLTPPTRPPPRPPLGGGGGNGALTKPSCPQTSYPSCH